MEGRQIVCKANVLFAPRSLLVYQEIIVRIPVDTEVRVKIVASGLCQSDLVDCVPGSVTPPSVLFPYVPGHEGTGIIESVGENVTNFRPGDKVMVMFFGKCGKCHVCKLNLSNHCEASMQLAQHHPKRVVPFRFHDGSPCFRFCGASTFSEYTLVEQDHLVKIERDDVDLRTLCLMSCGIPTGYGSAMNIAKVTKGSTVAIWGIGTVGLAAGLAAVHAGASMIIGIDINPEKFSVARKIGFTHLINPMVTEQNIPVSLAVKQLASGRGVTFSICCVGVPGAMQEAVDSLEASPVARAALVGCAPYMSRISIPLDTVYVGATITGGRFGGFRQEDLPGLIEKVKKDEIDLSVFISRYRFLNEVDFAVDDLMAGSVLRTIIIVDKFYQFGDVNSYDLVFPQ